MISLEEEIEKLIDEIFKKLDGNDDSEEHDRLVDEFFNYCIEDYEKNGKLETMFVVSALLPKIVGSGSYVESLTNSMDKLTCQKLPQKYYPYRRENFTSTREHLWGYSFHHYKFPPDSYKFKIPELSIFKKFVLLTSLSHIS